MGAHDSSRGLVRRASGAGQAHAESELAGLARRLREGDAPFVLLYGPLDAAGAALLRDCAALAARHGLPVMLLERAEHVAVDAAGRQLLVDGRRIRLSPLELRLMQHLYTHRGEALSRDSLLDQVWGAHYEPGSNVVDVAIRSLRRKLGVHAGMIETVPRFGYRFQSSSFVHDAPPPCP